MLSATFYRTSLELKHNNTLNRTRLVRVFLSNQFGIETFLRCHKRSAGDWLFIEPVWNWNSTDDYVVYYYPTLFIEPVWNWNIRSFHFVDRNGAFYRTSLELKHRQIVVILIFLCVFYRTILELKNRLYPEISLPYTQKEEIGFTPISSK